jgi:hypothetical protein
MHQAVDKASRIWDAQQFANFGWCLEKYQRSEMFDNEGTY